MAHIPDPELLNSGHNVDHVQMETVTQSCNFFSVSPCSVRPFCSTHPISNTLPISFLCAGNGAVWKLG
jgi:hypothetical protein